MLISNITYTSNKYNVNNKSKVNFSNTVSEKNKDSFNKNSLESFSGTLFNEKATKNLVNVFDNYNEFFFTHTWFDKWLLLQKVKHCLKKGANPNAICEGHPVLDIAILHNCPKVADLLVESGANISKKIF